MKSKIFWLLTFVLFTALFFKGKFKKKRLFHNMKVSYGYVIKVRSGVVTGGGIQYIFVDNRTKYKQLMPWGVECEQKVRSMLSQINNIKFPIAYDSKDPSNSEILLFRSQYEKYGLEIPKELKEIVEEISKCE